MNAHEHNLEQLLAFMDAFANALEKFKHNSDITQENTVQKKINAFTALNEHDNLVVESMTKALEFSDKKIVKKMMLNLVYNL